MTMTWSEQIKTRRHELQLTQTAVASRIGITTNYLARLENAHAHPSSGLQAQIDRTLKDWSDLSPLTVQVDYLRVRFPTNKADHIIKDLCWIDKDFINYKDWGRYGYADQYQLGDITILTSTPTQKLGILLEMHGSGCRQFESMLIAHGMVWEDFLYTCLQEKGIIKRIDFAINDHVGLLAIPELVKKCQNNEYISVMRKYEALASGKLLDDKSEATGDTLYLGSKKSDIYFCIYNKEVEQAQKGVTLNAEQRPIKTRFEVRLFNERAILAVEDFLSHRNLENTVFGIIQRYVRFVDKRTGKARNQWPLNKRWAQFCGKNRAPVQLTLAPELPNVNRQRAWIQTQVAPTLKALFNIDGYQGTLETMQDIKNAKLSPQQEAMIREQTVGVDYLVEQLE